MSKLHWKPLDPRPQKGGWAPGHYVKICIGCKERFIGGKQAAICADCAYGSEVLSLEDEKALKKGIEDIKAGRTIILDPSEFVEE